MSSTISKFSERVTLKSTRSKTRLFSITFSLRSLMFFKISVMSYFYKFFYILFTACNKRNALAYSVWHNIQRVYAIAYGGSVCFFHNKAYLIYFEKQS